MLTNKTMKQSMKPEIKLVITRNNEIVQIVTREVDTSNFVKTIENFQDVANKTLTKLIEDSGSSEAGFIEEVEAEESDPDEEDCTNPKKKRK